ncbi:hypothetical protein [Streptacidiphilus carbonis]|jgi:hypothetical protein|uniref:hypothetical protein n=1 Tax=Streptacidiphilus carbonis TaxID=105422 RepID=UPI00126A1E38|nr:hypothetical protein [Streptacidiphilus carbonis]
MTTLIKLTGRPMTAACLGAPAAVLPIPAPILAGLGGFGAGSDVTGVEGGLATWMTMRDERPMSASVAAVEANRGHVYAPGAGNHQQYASKAYRGPEPWRDRP